MLCPSCWHVVTTPCASTAVDAGWGQAVLGGTERGDPLAHCPLPQPGCPTCPTYPARHCWARSLPAPSRWRDPAASSTATPMPPTPFGWRWPLPTVSARCSSTSPPGQGDMGGPSPQSLTRHLCRAASAAFRNPLSRADVPRYKQLPTARSYMTLETAAAAYSCSAPSPAVLRVGDDTACRDQGRQDPCNGPLPSPGPYR